MASITASTEKETLKLQENKIVLLWSLTVWLVVMNTTMFNVALPAVLSELSLTSSTASWIVSGYSIAFAISTLTFSRLSDYIPISRLLFIGLTLLGISSFLGFFANHYYLLLAIRILQAAGAGAVPGLAMVLAGRYIPVSRRGKAMAYISSAASLGFGLGPVIGGAITQYFGWNYLFAVTSFVVLFVPVFNKLLPIEEVKKVKFDAMGGALTAFSVTGFLLFFSTFSSFILIPALLSTVLMWLHLNKEKNPFIQPNLLKNAEYTKLLFMGFSAFFTHFSTLFIMPIILSDLYEKDPAAIGMIIFPGAILSAIAAQFIGRLIDHFGNAPLIFFGHLFLVISAVLFAFLEGISPYFILFSYIFMSVGFSAFTASISNEVSRILPVKEIGAGMGMAQLTQFFGGAFGVAITGLLLSWETGFSSEYMYRSIFSGLAILIFLSSGVFFIYFRNRKATRLAS